MNYCQFRNDFIKRMANAGGGGLPAEYQQVEYITNTLNGYIDTGIALYNHEFELDISFQSSTSRVLIGYTDIYACYYFGKNASNNYELGGGITLNVRATDRHICKFKAVLTGASSVTCTLNVDGAIITRSSSEGTIEAFCTGSRNPFTSYAGVKTVYSIKARDTANSLVLHLIPCYRKADNVVGMYDIINKNFKTNAGNGQLIAGNPV